jgi:hypothetical protein
MRDEISCKGLGMNGLRYKKFEGRFEFPSLLSLVYIYTKWFLFLFTSYVNGLFVRCSMSDGICFSVKLVSADRLL